MVFTKKEAKASSVMVETKKLSGKDTCCSGAKCFRRIKHLLMFILVIVNTILLICVLCNQTRIESDRVGGRDNYKMVQQIYKSPTFKAQQKQQIEQALQQYQGGGTQAVTTAQPTTTTTTAPTVAQ